MRGGDRGVALDVGALAGHPHGGHRLPDDPTGGLHRPEHAPRHEVGDGGGADEPRGQDRSAGPGGPRQQHLAHVRVRSARLVEEVVAVVPPHDQPEVSDRREGGRPGADDDRGVPSQGLEEGGVARLGPLVGGQPRVPPGPDGGQHRRLDPHDVAVVGDDDDRSPSGLDRRAHGLGDERRPAGAGVGRRQRQDGGRRAAPPPHVVEERGPGGVAAPRRRLVRRQRRALRRPDREGLFGPGVAGRHRKAQDVAERARVPVGDVARELEDLRGEDRFRRHEPPQRAEPSGVLGGVAALEDPAVEVLAREAHLDPGPGHGPLGHRLWNGVLEGPVEVGEPGVDLDQRHGAVLGGRVVPREASRGARPTGGDEGQLPRVLTRLRHGPEPSGARRPSRGRRAPPVDDAGGQPATARCSASTRSVRSHVKPFSTPATAVRPKCP